MGGSPALPRLHGFAVVPCPGEDALHEILRFENDFLAGASRMTDEAVLARFRRCAQAFQCVVRSGSAAALDLNGYFVLMPLVDECVNAIRCGRLRTGREIALDDLADRGDRCAGLYLSVVCARGARARAATLAAIVEKLREWHRDCGVRPLFVRAVTGQGARLLERMSDAPFVPDGTIREFDLAAYPIITTP